jgi:hypothetical protein
MRRHGRLPLGNKADVDVFKSDIGIFEGNTLIDGSKTSRTKPSPDGTKVRRNLSNLCSMSGDGEHSWDCLYL